MDIPACPFCGTPVNLDDPDVLYPNGTGWLDHLGGMRSYHDFRDVSKDQWCYTLHCPLQSGGCGAEMTGDSKEDAIARWSKRV